MKWYVYFTERYPGSQIPARNLEVFDTIEEVNRFINQEPEYLSYTVIHGTAHEITVTKKILRLQVLP